jgi:acyl dehydratase
MNEVRLEQLRTRLGEEVAVSDWLTIRQERIDQFAQTTGDDQWLHVDIVRAKKESPYGSTIAHGFLTLSLIGSLLRGVLSIQGVQMTVNYGLDRVRFAAPVPAAARIRGRFTVKSVEPHRDAIKVVWHIVVEREVDEKACCIVDWVVLYYPAK